MTLKSKLVCSYLILLGTYAGFMLLPAPSSAILMQYGITSARLRLLEVTIVVLQALIWLAGFYGYAKLQRYADTIKGSKDGEQVVRLTRGVLLLVMWQPVSSALSSLLTHLAVRHPEWLHGITIVKNYIGLLIPLAGYVLIGLGARGLSQMVRQRPSYRVTNLLTVLIIALSLVYFQLVATTENREMVYQMPFWLIVGTLVAPYLYMWSLGVMATYELYLYSAKVSGIVYRKSWDLLAFGIGWLVLASVAFQYLTTLTARLTRLSIYWLLLIVYSLLLVLSVGFLLIAFGTKRLQKIEEI